MKTTLQLLISKNLVKIRNQNRCSQEEIATVLDIKQPSYNRMESGRTRISADQLAVLANYYKIPIDYFLLDDRNEYKKVISGEENSSIEILNIVREMHIKLNDLIG